MPILRAVVNSVHFVFCERVSTTGKVVFRTNRISDNDVTSH